MLLAIHHLAVDGVSWRIIIEDLEAAYRSLRAGTPVELPTVGFLPGLAQALRHYAASTELDGSLARWREIEAADARLPDDEHGETTEASARSTTVSLGREETQALLRQVPAAYGTQINDVLLTALAQTLRGWTGRDSHRIDMEGHGREEWIGPLDLSRTVGWFTTLHPVNLDLEGAADEGAALKRIKEALRRLPERGLSYGVLRYADVDAACAVRLASRQSELVFNYLGQFDQVVADSQLFAFADEPSGAWHGAANERTHRLEVLAAVRDGCFEARWICSPGRDRGQVVERLAGDFIAALRGLIDHCTQPGVSGYTPSDFPLARIEQGALDMLVAGHPAIEDVYPLAPMQLLFLSVESSGAGLGFEQWVFRLRGQLDGSALRSAWNAIVARHGLLRTAFVCNGAPDPLQLVERQVSIPWEQRDWSSREPSDRDDDLEAFLRADRSRGFELGEAPLIRLTLIRVSDTEHVLVWSTHHLYVDGWSWPLIIRELGVAYQARLEGLETRLPPAGQYRSYIEWLARAAPDSRGFWSRHLQGVVAPTPLPFDPSPTHSPGREVRETSMVLDAATTAVLNGLAREWRVTLNTLMQGASAILLGHLSGRDEVVFGAAFSGRPAELAGVETLVGPCVNNLPVRVPLEQAEPLSTWLSKLHERNVEIAEHQYASLLDIQQWAGVPWRLRLFDSLIVYQNYQVDEDVLNWPGVELELLAAPDTTGYPLTLTVTPSVEISLKLAGQAELLSGKARDGARGFGACARRPRRATWVVALGDRVAPARGVQGRGASGGRLGRPPTPGLVRGSRERDGARRGRGLGGPVRDRPGGDGGQFLRSRRPLAAAPPGPRSAAGDPEERLAGRRVAAVPDRADTRALPE